VSTNNILLSFEPGAGGEVARVVLNRPEALNALSRGLIAELGEALAGLRARPPRAVVITGAGERAFCAGADLKERLGMNDDETRAFVTQLGQTFDAIAALPCPVIAALNGVALGGGLELALACDLRYSVENAAIGLPEVRVGILPGAGGTQRLPRLIGAAWAKELILTGARIDARRAERIGLVSGLASDREALERLVKNVLGELAQCGPIGVREAKAAIDEGFDLPMHQALISERAHYEVTLVSDDRDEALAAFSQKRPPQFQGR
jgi:enoyl-CoA hydratase/carnithine racemase